VPISVRDFRPSDRAFVKNCLLEMTKHHARIDPWGHVHPSAGLGEAEVVRVLREVRKMHGFILIAESGRSRTGFVAGWVERPSRARRLEFRPYRGGYICDIAVIPSRRRQGIGSALLTAAEIRLKQSGCSVIALNTFYPNLAGRGLYRRFRYSPRGLLLAKRLGTPPRTWTEALRPPSRRATRSVRGR
jgi:ribosomal protein S18 acetylase RimI-like enzyme